MQEVVGPTNFVFGESAFVQYVAAARNTDHALQDYNKLRKF